PPCRSLRLARYRLAKGRRAKACVQSDSEASTRRASVLKPLPRYQHCPFLRRRLRDLWLLCVPFWAVRVWLRNRDDDLEFDICWSIARGYCDVRRRYYYAFDEIFGEDL